MSSMSAIIVKAQPQGTTSWSAFAHKLKFKKMLFFGYTVPLTAYPIQQPSGNPGGTVNISSKFKMRPSPNGHNTHAPMRCSPPRVSHSIVSRQLLSVDWGYDCHEEDAPEVKSYRRIHPL